MKNYPKLFYQNEKKPLLLIGYTLALGLMGVGVLETIISIPQVLKGEADLMSVALGPVVTIAGGLVAGGYLKEAGIIY